MGGFRKVWTWSKDFWSKHPILDHFLPLVVVVGLTLKGWMGQGIADADRMAAYGGVATIAGLVMAAAAFICTLTYQSSNILMSKVVERFSHEIRKNWVSIILWSFFAAAGPILCIILNGFNRELTFVATIYLGILLVLKFLRSVWWLQFTLFMQNESFRIPPQAKFAIREDLVQHAWKSAQAAPKSAVALKEPANKTP